MSTREVLRDQWVTFFEAFTTEFAGRLVSFGVDGRQPQHEIVEIAARELPLREIAVDLKDGENTIVISLGLSSDRLLRHSMQSVSHVRIAQAADGSTSALAIETMNGQTTTLNLDVQVSAKP